ncbi:MAG: hypothetical protein PHE06_08845 [Lachnospiraceae bacterium]|nr:hypothetical protein [Lachnospiraceae bacterium]
MMKKKLLISAVILGASAMMLTGFDSEATVDDVIKNYTEAGKNAKEFSAAIDLAAKASVSMTSETSGTSTMSMGMSGSLNAAYLMDPLSMSVDGSLTVDAMGVGQDMTMQMYTVTGDDGGLDSYVKATSSNAEESTGWEYSSVEADEVKQLTDLMTGNDFDLSQLPFTFTLGDSAVDVNGTSCYQLLATMTYDELKPFLIEAMSAAGEEDELDEDGWSMVDAIMSGFVINMEIDIADDTYLPAKMHIDMDGSDFTAISQLFAYSMAESAEDGSLTLPEIALDVSSLYIDAVYDYTTPVDITVPADALLAKTTDNDSNVSSIGDMVEDIAEDVSEAD